MSEPARRAQALRRVRAHPWLTGGVAVVVLAAAASAVYFATRSTPAAAQATTATQTVSTGTIRESVSASGTLAPAQQDSLDFAVSGTVTSVRVKAGDRVHEGQVLATVDSASLASTVAQAEASVASARAKVDDDASSGASDTQTTADEAALTAAENQLTSAKSQLASAALRSPITGVVASVDLTVGQSVSGGSTSNGNSNSGNGSSAQVLVISQDSWIVNATVDATSVGLVKVGNQAQLQVEGANDTVYGTIASVGLVASSASGTASYPVVVDVTGNPAGLRDGAGVTATLIYRQVSDVLVVPTLALHRASDGSTYVEKIVDGKVRDATVRTGLSSGGQTQITSGLSAGDTIRVPQLTVRRSGTNGGSGRLGTGGFGTGGFGTGGFGTGGFGTGGFGTGGGQFPAGTGGFGGQLPAPIVQQQGGGNGK